MVTYKGLSQRSRDSKTLDLYPILERHTIPMPQRCSGRIRFTETVKPSRVVSRPLMLGSDGRFRYGLQATTAIFRSPVPPGVNRM
jgi:hypothetical protein